MISLHFHLDSPEKDVKGVKFSEKSTVKDVKDQAVKSLSLKTKEFKINAYDFLIVKYGRDTILLRDDSKTLDQLGVVNGSVVFVSAPLQLKPPIPTPSVHRRPLSSSRNRDDRFKGFTTSNILKKYSGGLRPSEEKDALEFIDIHAAHVIKTADFLKLEKRRLKTIVQRQCLNVKESDLFGAVVEWAIHQCKCLRKEPTPENQRKLLDDVLPFIRFPTMTSADIAALVTPSKLLGAEEVVRLYAFMGASAEQQKTMAIPFVAKPRTARRPLHVFSWDPARAHTLITLSSENKVASSNSPGIWCSVFADIEFKDGIHEWEITLEQYNTTNGYNVCIGVVPTTFTRWSTTLMLGNSTAEPGWLYVCGTGRKVGSSPPQPYGNPAHAGDTIKVRLDLERRSIEFYLNGQSQGVAYTGINTAVRPAVSLINSQQIRLKFPSGGSLL